MRADYVPDYRHCLLPYVQWFQDDFLGGIRGMKAQEIGIYTVLLNEMYNRGVALDQSDERLARMCGADIRVFKKVLIDLIEDEKIVRLDCGLWNVRCENAFTSRAKMLEKQSEAGKTSAEKRRKNKGGLERPLNDRSTSVQPISESQTIIIEEDKSSSPSSRPAAAKEAVARSKKKALEAEFNETFWPAYPRKVEKKDALRAFLKARSTVSLDTIMAGLRVFASKVAGKDQEFIRHAATFLNGESWNNFAEVAAPPAPEAATEEDWIRRLRYGRQQSNWMTKWGPRPGLPGCLVPEHLLEPNDGAGWRDMELAA
ncbi:DUF1376 domain-containing protein [Rhizobium sp.]|uniref:DUF1376 domain-containing protein n=1 Tax=Rhizobium sp. TaxID=391 RepID=UPI0028A7EDF9